MKIIRQGDRIVMYRHWFKWYYRMEMLAEFPDPTKKLGIEEQQDE